MKKITDRYLELHNRRIDEYGFTARALWSGTESQQKRFFVLKDLFLTKEDFSVLDLGCGFGDFLPYIESHGIRPAEYYGFDINKRMIDEAKIRHVNRKFYTGSAKEFLKLKKTVDYIVSSGIYNLGESKEVVKEFFVSQFGELYKKNNIGFGINFLSDKSPAMDNVSVYHSPDEIFALCKKTFSSSVKLIEGYLPNDFTIFVYK